MFPPEVEVSILLAVIGAVAGATSWFWRFQLDKNKEEKRELKEEIRQLKNGSAPLIATLNQQIKQLEDALQKSNAQLQQLLTDKVKLEQLHKAAKDEYEQFVGQSQWTFEQMKATLAAKEKELEVHAEGLRTKDNEIRQLQEELERVKKKMHERYRRLDQTAEPDNSPIWRTPPIPSAVPAFVPMVERKLAIISVINLKGGVGKTTTTALLGAVFANKGYRVLLLDLDLQGTLSTFFINPVSIVKHVQPVNKGKDAAQQAKPQAKSIEAYFRAAMVSRKPKIIDYAVEPDRPEHVSIGADAHGLLRIVPATDRLVSSEVQLLIRWVLMKNKLDMRCLLRYALHRHAEIVGKKYDIVLIDCPPFMSISCVNALLASDYLLVPINNSVRSTERVPVLLDNINQLSVLLKQPTPESIIFMNYTDNSKQLTAKEKQLLEDLHNQCINKGHHPTKLEQVFIPFIRSEVSKQEVEELPLTNMSKLTEAYKKLAEAIERRMPNDCRRTAKTASRG